jgi:hypothetical protein
MKKIFGILALIMTIFTSCEVEPVDPVLLNNINNNSGGSNNNGGGNNNPTTPILLTKVIETLTNGDVETTEFFYNGSKILKFTNTTSNSNEETLYTYTGDLITQAKTNLNGVLLETTNFEYDTSLRLKKCTDIYGTTVNVTNYTYNTNGTITFITTEGSDIVANGTIYVANNQGYKKEIIYDPGTSFQYTEVQETTFDNKVNPFINVTGFSKIELETPSEVIGFSGVANNPVMLKRDNITRETSTYTYNSNNMPLNEVFTDLVNSTWSGTYQYFYNQ